MSAAAWIKIDVGFDVVQADALVAELRTTHARQQHGVAGIAAHMACGLQASMRTVLQQCQVGDVDGETQVGLRADATVGFDMRGAELHAHLLQQPFVPFQRDARVAAGTLAAHLSTDVGKSSLQGAVLA